MVRSQQALHLRSAASASAAALAGRLAGRRAVITRQATMGHGTDTSACCGTPLLSRQRGASDRAAAFNIN